MNHISDRKIIKHFFILSISFFLLLSYSLPAIAAGSISGKVSLQSRSDHSEVISFKLKNPGESTPIQAHEVNTPPDGSYQLNNIPAGIYNLSAKAPNSLSQNYVLIEVAEGQNISNINFSLLVGDANDDNKVNYKDRNILKKAYGSVEGDLNWDERADFNGDNKINYKDRNILKKNYGKNGFEPLITINLPEDDSVTADSPIAVSGTVDNDVSTVTVNGLSATVDSGTFYVENIPLLSGTNTISAIAADVTGNKNADLVNIIYDTTPPLTPVATDDGLYTVLLTELHASWSSEDPESDIVEYQYSIGTIAGTDDILGWTSAGTDLETTHTGLSLTQGQEYYINVKSKNGAGYWSEVGSSDGIIANDETTLLVNICSPEKDSLFNSTPVIAEGTVSSNSASVVVNGIPVTVTDNSFGISLDITEYHNFITARAVSGEQNAEDQISVYLDITPPSIYVLTPGDNVTTRSNVIYGRVSDDTVFVTIEGNQAELIDNFFVGEAALVEGINTISVEAQDNAGNIGQINHSFTLNTITPKVTITSPTAFSTIDSSPITVTGTIASDIINVIVSSLTMSTPIIEDLVFTTPRVIEPFPSGTSVIKASGVDENDNDYEDAVIVNTPDLKNYNLYRVSGDIKEYESELPGAGGEWDLTVRGRINNALASNEEIEFNVVEGSGTLSGQSVYTDSNGEAVVTLTTDTDASVTNKVEVNFTNYPDYKTNFSVDTKSAEPGNLTNITDETVTPVPGTAIPVVVKLTDAYGNVLEDEQIDFSITQGIGTLSANFADTNMHGEAIVNFTAPSTPETLTRITVSSASNPSVSTVLNITTSEAMTVTVEDIMAKVNANDEKIQDAKADIAVTSNASFLPPTLQLKIWQKGNKQKVEEIYPGQRVEIRPPLEASTEYVEMQREIISYDSDSNIYVIKTKRLNDDSYDLGYVDFSRGVVVRSEYYFKDDNIETKIVREYSDFIELNDIWGFQKEVETIYMGEEPVSITTKIYSNIQINTGIPDSEFE